MAKQRTFGQRFGVRIRARREELGLTQAKLAEKAGVTSNYVGVLERGLKLPTLDTLVKVAKALETRPADLLGEVRSKDAWTDEVASLATKIPEEDRQLALSVLKVVATSR